MIWIPTPVEGAIIVLLLYVIYKLSGWRILLRHKNTTNLAFHSNPMHPSGGFFEIPDDADPEAVRNLVPGAVKDAMRDVGEKTPKAKSGDYI